MSELFWLNDAQWARLKPLLPTDVQGVPLVDDRRVISGIIHVLRSGCRWVDAPPSSGLRETLYNRFVRWTLRRSGNGSSRPRRPSEGRPSRCSSTART